MSNPAHVPVHLLQKYSQRVPRYTSYPTAPHFRSDISAAEQEQVEVLWQKSNDTNKPISIYMHIPFCEERCWFCGCNTLITKKNQRADIYLQSLFKEFANYARLIKSERPVEQLALGGGTPNFLSPQQIDLLFGSLKEFWHFSESAEISVELDPRTMNEEKMEAFLRHGFNRFSMGIQDFNGEVLDAIHRHQSLEQTVSLLQILEKYNITAYNFDLIYGLPAQTLQTMSGTLDTVLEYRPSRIALYSYAHVPWMKSHQKLLERHHLPTPAEKLALFGYAYDVLTSNGYVHIGMDHFALPKDELTLSLQQKTLHRNFMGYTTRRGLDILGFGASAISSVGGTYVQNARSEEEYRQKIDTSSSLAALERAYILSPEDNMRRELIIDLFCNFYLDIKKFGERWQINFEEHFAPELEQLQALQSDGLLNKTSEHITVTSLGRGLIRNICVVFDQYMENDPAKRTYSQAI